jgi:hypothetical protein
LRQKRSSAPSARTCARGYAGPRSDSCTGDDDYRAFNDDFHDDLGNARG